MKSTYIHKNIELQPKNFIKALTIDQRYQYFEKKYNEKNFDFDEQALNEWINRKSVLNDEIYQELLKAKQYKMVPFSNAVKEDLSEFYDDLQKIVLAQDWFIKLNEIMKSNNESRGEYKKEAGYTFLIRPFLVFAEKELLPLFQKMSFLSEQTFYQTFENLANRLLKNALKTFVLELNISKLKGELSGATPEERFESFIYLKGQPEALAELFSEYAVLAKILVRETELFIKNTAKMFNRLNIHKNEIQKLFKIEDLTISNIVFGEGDTHQKGKSVVTFKFTNNKRIVYKPKKLQIIKPYNALLKRLRESQNFLEMKELKCLIQEEYSFEEYIEYKPCETKKEVENYYTRFGQILAIMHMINANDLHMENLIAHGEYPCIVDLETIFQNKIPYDIKNNADIKGKYNIMDFVSNTLLLPEKIIHNEKGDVIELSALSGKEQVLVKKGYKLKHNFTDNVKYELDNLKIASSNNLVYLKEEQVDFNDYISNILNGFEETMRFFMKNKEELLQPNGLIHQFKGLDIRLILRSTYIYAQLLDNTTHPDYMRDYYYYEQIIENIWTLPVLEKHLIVDEYEDLMNGDIPIFFTKTSCVDIYNSNYKKYDSSLQQTGLYRVCKKIEQLTEEHILQQMTVIRTKIGAFEQRPYHPIKSVNKPLDDIDILKKQFVEEAIRIGEDLISSAIICEESKTITWISINDDDNKQWDVGTAEGDLYQGLSGVALFYHYLYQTTHDLKYKKYRDYTFNMAMKKVLISKYNSGVLGYASIIYPAVKVLENGSERKYKQAIQEAFTFINNSLNTLDHIDWLHGKSSVIEMLLLAYKINADEVYIETAISYAIEIMNSEITDNLQLGGLAHGFSGIASTLLKLGHLTNREDITNFGLNLLKKDQQLFDEKLQGWLDNRISEPTTQHFWCHGSVGIGLSRLNILEYTTFDDQEIQEDILKSIRALENVDFLKNDCLCHGNMGLSEYYIELFKQTKNEAYYKKAISIGLSVLENQKQTNRYNLTEFYGFKSIGLFKGLSGIGYAYLRLANPFEIDSVLRLS